MQRRSRPIPLSLIGSAGLALCMTGTAEAQRPDFTGVWSGLLTTDSHPYWNLEDVSCFAGCPAVLYERVAASLDDPANRGKGEAMQAENAAFLQRYVGSLLTPEGVKRFEAAAEAQADLESYCEPYGMLRLALNPLPMRIRDEGDRLVFEYEEWGLTRTIHLGDGDADRNGAASSGNGAANADSSNGAANADSSNGATNADSGNGVTSAASSNVAGDEPSRAPSPLGYSVGRYENDALMVTTTALTGDYYQLRQGSYSDAATIEERYVIHDDPRRLVLEATVTDPVTLVAPYVWTKTWLFTPDVELIEDSCEDVPGQL